MLLRQVEQVGHIGMQLPADADQGLEAGQDLSALPSGPGDLVDADQSGGLLLRETARCAMRGKPSPEVT